MPAIMLKNFSYAYPRCDKALNNINLSIAKGSFSVILGPSGAGKTTLCLAVAGAVPQYFGGSLSGLVLVEGKSAKDTPMHDLSQNVGTVLQDYETQLVAMTVEEEVAFGLENLGLQRAEINLRVREALQKVGLAGYEKREVTALSGGQKQRLVIASVLAAAPKILVLDEPASALDPEGTAELYTLLGDLNKQHGITILVVEHRLSEVLPHADNFILLEHGSAIQTGSPEKVFSYMWKERIFDMAIPPLLKLKFTLEEKTGISFSTWHRECDAIAEIRRCLNKGVSLSA